MLCLHFKISNSTIPALYYFLGHCKYKKQANNCVHVMILREVQIFLRNAFYFARQVHFISSLLLLLFANPSVSRRQDVSGPNLMESASATETSSPQEMMPNAVIVYPGRAGTGNHVGAFTSGTITWNGCPMRVPCAWPPSSMAWSLCADIGPMQMAVAHRIADIVHRADGRDGAGSIDVCYWDVASIAQRRVRLASDAGK
jgi:hypothetical protein